jgi:sulfate transport system ATP-binding protein
VPGHADREARIATLYIRPHQLEIEREGSGEQQFRARVVRVNAAGPLVKVDLTAEWGDPVRVELSQERFRALALEMGTDVFVRPRDMSIFTA